MSSKILTQARLKELVIYNPETGELRFTDRRFYVPPLIRTYKKYNKTVAVKGRHCIKKSKPAGHIRKTDGYVVIWVDGILYPAHRIAWLYVTGAWPSETIDHINGVTSDNRFCNLREATQAEQCQNICLSKKNKSGFPGVHWHKLTKKWRVQFRIDGKITQIGMFENLKDAIEARLNAKAKYHAFEPSQRLNKGAQQCASR